MIPNLKIVILNMDLKDDTLELIESLQQAGAYPEQIILVDNASTDGSVEAIRAQFKNAIQLIQNQENIGFAAGNNQGFEKAYQLGAEWVLLLNNDTIVAPDFFDQIEKAIDTNSKYEILSPAIFYYSEPDILWHLGSFRIPGTLLARNRYSNKPLPKNLPDLLPVDFISGCAMLIKSDVYKKVGLFDARFFAYWEEVDFCFRARKSGFQICVMINSRIWHKVSKTANRDKSQKRYLNTRNIILYTRKNANILQKIIMFAYLIFRLFITMIGDLIFQQPELIRKSWMGWRDGWRTPNI